MRSTQPAFRLFIRQAAIWMALAVLVALPPAAPKAAPANAVVPGSPSLAAKSATWMTVASPFEGDDNQDSYTVYEYSQAADGPWSQGCGAGVAGESFHRFCAIAALTPGTDYWVRITFVDADGVSGTNPQVAGPFRTDDTAVSGVTVGAATVSVQDTGLMVSVPISGDSDANSSLLSVETAPDSVGPWTQRCATVTSTYAPKLCGIHGLTHDTDYWVRVTVGDPDGVSGTNPQMLGPIHYTGLTDLAIGRSVSADPGWGCCADPSALVDGRIQHSTWTHGYAWTGGIGNWDGGTPGWKQATLDLGSTQTIERLDVWMHQNNAVPTVWKVQTSDDGNTFADAYATTTPRCRTAASGGMNVDWSLYSCHHIATFTPVQARFVRYLFDDTTLPGGMHGWVVELEVFGASTPSTTYTISGRVHDTSNNPVQGVVISDGAGHNATTDGMGNYTLSGLAAGSYSLSAAKPNYSFTPSSPTVAVPPNAPGQDFTATPVSATATITGHVTDSNKQPIAGVTISDGTGHSATTDGMGNYTLSGLAAGSYSLSAAKPNYSFIASSRTVVVPPDADNQNFLGSTSLPAWTFMLYLAGDNNLAADLRRAIRNLEAQPDNPNVRLVVLFDGDHPSDSRRFLVQPGGAYTRDINNWPMGELNMGNPQTLADFISWTRAHYPAQHYYLAIGDHGRGTSGVAWDDTSSLDNLSPADLHEALNLATVGGQWKIDVLHYDTCLMAMIEEAYQVSDYANYLVASENLGWSVFAYAQYARAGVLQAQRNPSSNVATAAVEPPALQLATAIAQTYFNNTTLQGFPRTVSVFDLSQTTVARQAVDKLATVLRSNLGTLKNQLRTIRDAAQKFDSRDYYRITKDDEYVDLYDLAGRLNEFVANAAVQAAAQDTMNALGTLVVAEYHQSGIWDGGRTYWNLDNAHGVAIYFPPAPNTYDYEQYTDDQLFLFTADSQWDELLEAYMAALGLPFDPNPGPGIPPMLNSWKTFLPLLQKS